MASLLNRRDGYGDGSGDGYGYGYGDGYGYGSGDGDGSGYGDGYALTTIAGHEVRVRPPWPVVAVGCQAHTLAEWRARWEELADEHEAEVTEAEAERVIAAVEEALGSG